MELMEYKYIRELYDKLDYWRAYTPNNMASNMYKVSSIRSLEREIALEIEVDKYRKYLLEKEKWSDK